jgi:hypothetical protein
LKRRKKKRKRRLNLETRCMIEYVSNNEEFKYLEMICKYYKIDYVHICDFALDLYNYQIRCGLDILGAKIMSLNNARDYAYIVFVKEGKHE